MQKTKIYILADFKIGTFKQSLSLAEEFKREFNIEYKILNIEYNSFKKLPNFLLSRSLIRLSENSRKMIKEENYAENSIIFSAGRLNSPTALYIKSLNKKNNKKTYIVQILNPNINFKLFDKVILPYHDIQKYKKLTTVENILPIYGSFSSLTPSNTKGSSISLLVGGKTKSTKISENSAKKLANICSNIAKNMNLNLNILNSRRTGDLITNLIVKNLNCNYQLYDWKNIKDKNPYEDILNDSKYVIVTGDSVSMISDILKLGISLYIFDEENISSSKHRIFHNYLYKNNLANKITNQNILTEIKYNAVNEAERIVKLLKIDLENFI